MEPGNPEVGGLRMARLVAALERDFSTDFALLYARQERVEPSGLTSGTFAASEPGIISMVTGAKSPDVRLRLECWDSRPDWVGDEWEDCDELPWASVAEGGRLSVHGFDPPTGEGLPVERLAAARVQVFASGRHQYSPCDVVGSAPERWLVRIWPDAGPTNALAGPPRRIAGPVPYSRLRSPWEAAVYGWRLSGWSSVLSCLRAFGAIENAVRQVGRPFEREDLVPFLGPFDWTSPVNLGMPMTVEARALSPGPYVLLDTLARVTGLPEVATFADAFTCLLRLGLLARCDTPSGERLVPNPAPEPVAPLLTLSSAVLRERSVRLAPHIDVSYLDGDLATLARWSPNGLVTTPRAIAVRLSLPSEDLVEALRLRALVRPGALDVDPLEIGPDTTITLREAPRAQAL